MSQVWFGYMKALQRYEVTSCLTSPWGQRSPNYLGVPKTISPWSLWGCKLLTGKAKSLIAVRLQTPHGKGQVPDRCEVENSSRERPSPWSLWGCKLLTGKAKSLIAVRLQTPHGKGQVPDRCEVANSSRERPSPWSLWGCKLLTGKAKSLIAVRWPCYSLHHISFLFHYCYLYRSGTNVNIFKFDFATQQNETCSIGRGNFLKALLYILREQFYYFSSIIL